ncbi:hypothetical protein GCM10009720_17990 [Yaniella flava]|uniref:Uncharacterized protein n=2 Tax=Yaniella flava TaxID=287930 RepID=A0ABP5G2A5_9MICC
MQAEEFYSAYQVSFDGIGRTIEAAYHGYDDSDPIMVEADSAGQRWAEALKYVATVDQTSSQHQEQT